MNKMIIDMNLFSDKASGLLSDSDGHRLAQFAHKSR